MVMTRSRSIQAPKAAAARRHPTQKRQSSKSTTQYIPGERFSTRLQLQENPVKASREEINSSSSSEEDDPTDKTYQGRGRSSATQREAEKVSELKRKFDFKPADDKQPAKKKARVAKDDSKAKKREKAQVKIVVEIPAWDGELTPPPSRLTSPDIPLDCSVPTSDEAGKGADETSLPPQGDHTTTAQHDLQEEPKEGRKGIDDDVKTQNQPSDTNPEHRAEAVCDLDELQDAHRQSGANSDATVPEVLAKEQPATLVAAIQRDAPEVEEGLGEVTEDPGSTVPSEIPDHSFAAKTTSPHVGSSAPEWAPKNDVQEKQEYVVKMVEQDNEGRILLADPIRIQAPNTTTSRLGASSPLVIAPHNHAEGTLRSSNDQVASIEQQVAKSSENRQNQGVGVFSDSQGSPQAISTQPPETVPETVQETVQKTVAQIVLNTDGDETAAPSPSAPVLTVAMPNSAPAAQVSPAPVLPVVESTTQETQVSAAAQSVPVQALLSPRIRLLRQDVQNAQSPATLKGTPPTRPVSIQADNRSAYLSLLPRRSHPTRKPSAPRTTRKTPPAKSPARASPTAKNKKVAKDQQEVLLYSRYQNMLNDDNVEVLTAGMKAVKMDKSQAWEDNALSVIEVLATWSLLKRQMLVSRFSHP